MITYEVVIQDGRYFGKASIGNRRLMVGLCTCATYTRIGHNARLFVLANWQLQAEQSLM